LKVILFQWIWTANLYGFQAYSKTNSSQEYWMRFLSKELTCSFTCPFTFYLISSFFWEFHSILNVLCNSQAKTEEKITPNTVSNLSLGFKSDSLLPLPQTLCHSLSPSINLNPIQYLSHVPIGTLFDLPVCSSEWLRLWKRKVRIFNEIFYWEPKRELKYSKNLGNKSIFIPKR